MSLKELRDNLFSNPEYTSIIFYSILLLGLIVYGIGIYQLVKGKSKQALLILLINTFTLGITTMLIL